MSNAVMWPVWQKVGAGGTAGIVLCPPVSPGGVGRRLEAGMSRAVTELGLSARLGFMNAHVDHILDEALGLPPDERSALTVALLDSLEGSDDSSVTEAWRQEIRARQAALRAGTAKAVSWAEARARLSTL